MRGLLKKLATFKNLVGLLYIIFYFSYIAINMQRNNGNYIINIILLILTFIYLGIYIYCVFIDYNKKIRKHSKKVFTRLRKFLGFINAGMIVASVFSNDTNTFFTIFFAVITIAWYLLYFFVDITSTLALHEFKKFNKNMGWKYDNRN